jgi:hypothetical protein
MSAWSSCRARHDASLAGPSPSAFARAKLPARTDKNSSERRLFTRRRELIGLVGGAAAWPLTAGAQQRALWGGAVIYWVRRQSYELSDRVFAAYVSRHGHAFIDRALYLPKGSTDDPARPKATYVPSDRFG